MKKWLVLLGGMVVVLGLGSLAWAGDYHFGANLICSDCHVMHAQTSHTYGGQNVKTVYTPTPFLLKGPANDLCLTCHDGSASPPDVFADNTGANARQAGALNRVGSSQGGYQVYMGHTLDSTDAAPGGTWVPTAPATGLECVHCHHQHGSAGTGATDVAGNAVSNAYRNLRMNPGVGTAKPNIQVSYASNTNDLTKDVFERFPKAYTMGDVNLNEPNTTDSGFAQWCRSCHTNFHGAVGGPEIGGTGTPPEEFIRHPSSTANIGAIGGGHSSLTTFANNLYRSMVMSPTGNWGTQGAVFTSPPTDLTPTCLSCHKSHGNKRPFGLIYILGNAPLSEDGDGIAVRDLCKQCHRQGG